MHAPFYSESDELLRFEFADSQDFSGKDQKLAELIREKVTKRERFYGIEVSARSKTILDYSKLHPLPLFTSFIWVGENFADVEPIDSVPSILSAWKLRGRTAVLPHFSCFKANEERLRQFLSQEFTNVFTIRGDDVREDQDFKHASELVREVRRIRGDDVCIGVGGYPEIHPTAMSREEDLQYLKEKVDSGADFIITQMCFSAENLIDFVRNCRNLGITVPIIPGMCVPENFKALKRMCEVTKVSVPSQQWEKFKELRESPKEFKEFSVANAVQFIQKIFLENDLDVFGVHFFTLNRFSCVAEVVRSVFDEEISVKSIE